MHLQEALSWTTHTSVSAEPLPAVSPSCIEASNILFNHTDADVKILASSLEMSDPQWTPTRSPLRHPFPLHLYVHSGNYTLESVECVFLVVRKVKLGCVQRQDGSKMLRGVKTKQAAAFYLKSWRLWWKNLLCNNVGGLDEESSGPEWTFNLKWKWISCEKLPPHVV